MKTPKCIKNLFVTRSFFNRRIQEETNSLAEKLNSMEEASKSLEEEMKSLAEESRSFVEKQTLLCLKESERRWNTLMHQSIVDRFLYRYYTKKAGNDTDHYVAYYYGTFGNICNIGDYFQSIATEKAISLCQNETCKFVYVQRNQLIGHPGGTCVMQGWYEHEDLGFLPGDDTRAIWIGTHFTESICQCLSLLFKNSSYRPYDVGCRDKATLDFCRAWGISSYFSRCLTLTLPKRSKEEDALADVVYLVDCSEEVISMLPDKIKAISKTINQRKFVREPWQSWTICREAAEKLLDEYKQHARLVITSALHCAQPCIAMGIPVVFINPAYDERERFSSMDGILPQYTVQDLKDGKIDFNPQAPDIEELKVAMLTNLKLSLKEKRNMEEGEERIKARETIEKFNVLSNR